MALPNQSDLLASFKPLKVHLKIGEIPEEYMGEWPNPGG
jgi:hypothetical protein